MSSDRLADLHPVVVVDDRYGGVYSGGAWWAVAEANRAYDGSPRIVWLWAHGPGSDDVSAAYFWSKPPAWIAAGATPDEAVTNLIANKDAESDDWVATLIDSSTWNDELR